MFSYGVTSAFFPSRKQIPCTFLHHWHTWLTTIRQFEWMTQIEDRFLWEELSIFFSFRHTVKWSWEVLEAERDPFTVWICLHRSVCVCVLLCVVGIESYPGLICSHHGALAAGVPIHLWSEHTTSYPGKMLSTRVGLPQGSVDIWAMPGMFLFIKGQHLAIFISAIKHAAVRGKRGSKCEKRLGNDEEREEAVLEFQHLLELYLLPMQQYWPKEWWLLLLRCMVFRSPLIIGQRWPIDDWLIWGFSAAVTSAAFKWMWVKINIWTSIVTLTILNKSNYVLRTQTMEMSNWTHNTVCFLHLTIIFYSSLLWF